MNDAIAAINEKIIEECISYLVIASETRIAESDVIRMVAEIVQCSGGTIDACSLCGAMPMNTNCNNAGCDQ